MSKAEEISNAEAFSHLSETTYGMEIEKHNFIPDDKLAFTKEYIFQIEVEQKERIKAQLGLPVEDDKLRAGSLCTIYKIENYNILVNKVREEIKGAAGAGRVKNLDIEIRNQIISKSQNYDRKEIFQVRLDGEKEFPLLNLEDIEELKQYIDKGHNLFNVEFISAGKGIKRHKDFFNHFISKDKNNEVRESLDNFSTAVSNLKKEKANFKEQGANENIYCLSISKNKNDAFLYEFPQWTIKYFKNSSPSRSVLNQKQGQRLEMLHVTHSIPIVRDVEYFKQLGETFVDEGRSKINTNTLKPIEMAFPSKNDEIIKNTDDITLSRNNNQPLFKSPREHFEDQDENDARFVYLEETRRGKILQPTSNRLDFIDNDLKIYKMVLQELKEGEQQNISLHEKLTSQFQPIEEIKILENTISKLEEIIKPYASITNDREKIRVFEAHDEKLQLIYTKDFAGVKNVYHGLLEGRERSSLVKYIEGVALGTGEHKFPSKYLSNLNQAIEIAESKVEFALRKELNKGIIEEEPVLNNKVLLTSFSKSEEKIEEIKQKSDISPDLGNKAKNIMKQASAIIKISNSKDEYPTENVVILKEKSKSYEKY